METQTWQDTLREVTVDLQKRQRLADEMGVTAIVLLRWVAGKAIPSEDRLNQLRKALPNYQVTTPD